MCRAQKVLAGQNGLAQQAVSIALISAGYALSIFIPISFVCVLPYEALRWAMIAVATVSSGLFLLLNFKGPIFDVAGAKCALCASSEHRL